jgi:hypothetical protein
MESPHRRVLLAACVLALGAAAFGVVFSEKAGDRVLAAVGAVVAMALFTLVWTTRVGIGFDAVVDRVGPRARSVQWADVEGFHVTRPGGLWPGMTVVAFMKDRSEVPLLSLTIDILPSSAATHARLREMCAELERIRALRPAPSVD